MTSLIETIFGSVRYDKRTDAYYWHPWLGEDDYSDLGYIDYD